MMILELKLVHRSGSLTCRDSDSSFSSNWGCGFDGHAESWTTITDSSKKELFPNTGTIPGGYTPKNAPSVVYTPTQAIPTNAGLDLQIWYTEDLKVDEWESNNGGTHCVDVLVKMIPGNNLNMFYISHIPEKNR